MVLESLITPFEAEHKHKRMALYGFLYLSVSLFLAWWVFHSQAGMVVVFLTSIACVPLLYKTIQREEEKDLQGKTEKWLLKEHWQALAYFMYLFIGVTVATALWYVVLPAQEVSALFGSQIETISSLQGGGTGAFAMNMGAFGRIFFNNLKVLIFCIVFSFLYGAGAIFILNWNATVVGVAIGNFIRSTMSSYAKLAGWEKVATYSQVVATGLFRYTIHGIPEILSYFTAGLAGGIISVAVIRHDYKTRKFEHILLDSADLLLISFALLFIAAVLEVFVTPVVFG